MEEIISQYGKIIITIVAIVALVIVITFIITGGDSQNGSSSLVHNLFSNLLNSFANKSGLNNIGN